jgi:DNA-binding response OmpR family regulator
MLSASMTPPRVLVAEDEPAMLSLVARHLRNLGFSVIEASEGDAAWNLAQEHVPDLVILDVMMPGMSGWEICKRLKSDTTDGRPFANTGVIMLTGIGENLNEMTSPLFAADAWLNKPFDFSELDERVRETLERYTKPVPEGEDEQGDVEPTVRGKGPKAPSTSKKAALKKSTASAKSLGAAKKVAAGKPAIARAPAKKAAPVQKAAPKKIAAKKAAEKKSAKR